MWFLNKMTKKFDFEKYVPLDYRNWVLGDKAREGANIKKLEILSEDELEIWNLAIPYQDQRDDPGQGEIVAYFAKEFLKYLKGNRKVVVPAAILHDVGWYGGDAKAWKRLVLSKTKLGPEEMQRTIETEEIRRPHQNRGCLITGRILEKAGWPEKYGNEIADIIGDHDTRRLSATENGEIVRASDLMWRVSHPCLQIYQQNNSAAKILEVTGGTALYMAPPRNLRETELKIARIEFVNSLFFKFGEPVKTVLGKEYKKELDKISKFYNKSV